MQVSRLRSLDKGLLALVFLILSASTIVWTLTNKTPPAWDPADHIVAGYDYYYPLAHVNLKAFGEEFFVAEHFYAPLVHLITAGIFLVFGASQIAGIGVNLISLALLLFSVSWMARALYAGEPDSSTPDSGRASLALTVVAPLLVAGYHFSAWLLHDAFLDYPLMAIVAVTFAFLLRARDFRSRRAALAFGLSAGLGILTKQTFVFFFILPVLYVTGKALIAKDRKAILNLLLAGLVVVAVAAIWYGPHLREVIEIYRVNKQAALAENEAPLFSYRSNLFYPHALASTQLQLPFGLLFVTGLVYSLVRRRTQSVMLYLWIISGIGSFALIANKDPRYTVPVLPAVALISVCWLPTRKWTPGDPKKGSLSDRARLLKPAVIAGAAVWAFVSFFNAQYPRQGMGSYIDTPDFRWMVFARNYFALDHRPLADDWSVPEVVRTIVASNSASESPQISMTAGSTYSHETSMGAPIGNTGRPGVPTVGVAVNLPYLNPSSLGLYARLLAPGRAPPPMFKVDWLVVESARDRVQKCNYLVVRTGLDRAEWVAPLERPVEDLILSHPERFIEVGRLPIPIDGAEVVIYKCGG